MKLFLQQQRRVTLGLGETQGMVAMMVTCQGCVLQNASGSASQLSASEAFWE